MKLFLLAMAGMAIPMVGIAVGLWFLIKSFRLNKRVSIMAWAGYTMLGILLDVLNVPTAKGELYMIIAGLIIFPSLFLFLRHKYQKNEANQHG